MGESAMSDYEKLMREVTVAKDRIRGVVHDQSTGLYLYGRPGTSKTFIVRSTLDLMAVGYTANSGHLTPIGLFDLLEENNDRIIVLDDVSAIFNQPIALQLLLAALGNPHDGSGIRTVKYKTARESRVVKFSGGVICMSNLPLDGHHQEVLAAIRDRVNVIHFDPSDDQIIALIFKLANDGIGGVDPVDAMTVASFLIAECKSHSVRPSIRLFVDKALKDFKLWNTGKCEAHWKDLVVSNLQQQLIELKQDVRDLSREENSEAERRIALDIYLSFVDRVDRITEWVQRTKKSQPSFYRRDKELKQDGRLPKS